MLFIHGGDQQSCRGKSLPLGLRRRSQRGSRDFYHGLLAARVCPVQTLAARVHSELRPRILANHLRTPPPANAESGFR